MESFDWDACHAWRLIKILQSFVLEHHFRFRMWMRGGTRDRQDTSSELSAGRLPFAKSSTLSSPARGTINHVFEIFGSLSQELDEIHVIMRRIVISDSTARCARRAGCGKVAVTEG